MVKYMYYNKRGKYFVSEYFYKNKIGCVKVDVEMYNVYNAFARSCYNDGKYYCTYDIGEFYPSVFWEVYRYEDNSKKEI